MEAKSLNVANSQSPPNLPPITATHLPPLAPIFPPPPFTPSHPAFLHISSVAVAESERIRASAEQYLAKITLDKVREIEDQENQLRRQAESLWVRFRETLETFEAEKRDMSHKRRDSGKWVSSSRTTSPIKENSGTPVSVNDFVPTAVTVPRLNPASGSITPRASALSASLATTSFHHPRENMNSGSPSIRAPSSTSVETEGSLSTASSKTLANQGNQRLEEVNDILEPFRRDMNEAKDVATSLLVLDLEAQMVRREQQRAAQEKAKAESDNQGNPPVGPSTQPQPPPSKPNGMARHTIPGLNDMSTPDNFVSSPESKKGKRKVTFDVQPDVVTIKRDVTKESDELILQSTIEAKRIQGWSSSPARHAKIVNLGILQFLFLTWRTNCVVKEIPTHPLNSLYWTRRVKLIAENLILVRECLMQQVCLNRYRLCDQHLYHHHPLIEYPCIPERTKLRR